MYVIRELLFLQLLLYLQILDASIIFENSVVLDLINEIGLTSSSYTRKTFHSIYPKSLLNPQCGPPPMAHMEHVRKLYCRERMRIGYDVIFAEVLSYSLLLPPNVKERVMSQNVTLQVSSSTQYPLRGLLLLYIFICTMHIKMYLTSY